MAKESTPPYIKTIAEMLDVSTTTVSLVLNGRGDELRISKSTQEKVYSAAREIGVFLQSAQTPPLPKKYSRYKKFILVLWNQKILTEAMGRFFKGLSSQADEKSYQVEFVVRLFEEDALKEVISDADFLLFSGLIVHIPSKKDMLYLESIRGKIPTVISGRLTRQLSCVYTDDYAIGHECARLFAEGDRRRAGAFVAEIPSTGSNLRMVGFREGCEEYGLELREEWIIKSDPKDGKQSVRAAKELFGSQGYPDCIVVQINTLAPGLFEALRELRLSSPQDVAVLVYGLSYYFEETYKPMSMVGGSIESFGRIAIDLMMTMISNKIEAPLNMIVPIQFRIGDSFNPGE